MPSLQEGLGFTGRPETHSFSGVLLDMDGTIVDSTDAIVKHWHKCDSSLPQLPYDGMRGNVQITDQRLQNRQRVGRGPHRDLAVFTREEIDRYDATLRSKQGQLGV